MKPFKTLILWMVLTILSVPLSSSAETVDSGLACANKTAVAFGSGIFRSLKNDVYSDLYKKAEKKRRLAKAHRRALLKKVKKSKRF